MLRVLIKLTLLEELCRTCTLPLHCLLPKRHYKVKMLWAFAKFLLYFCRLYKRSLGYSVTGAKTKSLSVMRQKILNGSMGLDVCSFHVRINRHSSKNLGKLWDVQQLTDLSVSVHSSASIHMRPGRQNSFWKSRCSLRAMQVSGVEEDSKTVSLKGMQTLMDLWLYFSRVKGD